MMVSARVFHALAMPRDWVDVTALPAITLRYSACLFLMAGLFVMPVTVAAQPPQKDDEPKIPTKEYAQTYSQSFKGSDVRPDGWNFTSRLSEEHVQFEPTGLRITLPPGGPEAGQTAGIRSAFGVKGDFVITLNFEALKDPDPADAGKSGTRFSLGVTLDTPLLDTPKSEAATLNRSMATKGFSTWARTRHQPAPLSHGFPTPATIGRLRMVRSGDELFYLASVGADQPFVFLKKYRFGADDVQRVGISASTGGVKAMLDIRVTDFRIRADGIPGAPEIEAARPPQNLPAPERESGRGWLVAGLVATLAFVAVLMLGVFLRMRGGVARRTMTDAESTPDSFACPKCAKVLKTKAEMAGKKVKCPKCGAVVLAPTIEAGKSGDVT